MSEEAFNHVVYSKNVIEFVTVANEYCAFVENNGNFGRSEFIDKMQKLFPLLYLKSSLLPEVDDENAGTPEKFLSEVDYNFILNKISEKLGQFDSYQEVFDEGMQYSETAIGSSISENICDIYQDLKDFLLAFRIGTIEIMNDALWECRNNFASYWGQRLVNGLRALHALKFGDVDLEEGELPRDNTSDKNEKSDGWIANHFNNFFEDEDLTTNDI
jgi:hypothetical protein